MVSKMSNRARFRFAQGKQGQNYTRAVKSIIQEASVTTGSNYVT